MNKKIKVTKGDLTRAKALLSKYKKKEVKEPPAPIHLSELEKKGHYFVAPKREQ